MPYKIVICTMIEWVLLFSLANSNIWKWIEWILTMWFSAWFVFRDLVIVTNYFNEHSVMQKRVWSYGMTMDHHPSGLISWRKHNTLFQSTYKILILLIYQSNEGPYVMRCSYTFIECYIYFERFLKLVHWVHTNNYSSDKDISKREKQQRLIRATNIWFKDSDRLVSPTTFVTPSLLSSNIHHSEWYLRHLPSSTRIFPISP